MGFYWETLQKGSSLATGTNSRARVVLVPYIIELIEGSIKIEGIQRISSPLLERREKRDQIILKMNFGSIVVLEEIQWPMR